MLSASYSGCDPEANLLKTAATRTKAPIDATSTSTHSMICENATHSRRMMEAAVQSGSAGTSGPLGSVPPGKKGRADSLLNTSAIVARTSFQALPLSGLSSAGRWFENMSRATVISLELPNTLMCVAGGEQRKVNADACNVRRPLAGALSDGGSRQGGEQQDGADAEQDDILEYELAGEVPGYRVSRQAPVNDTWRRKEE